MAVETAPCRCLYRRLLLYWCVKAMKTESTVLISATMERRRAGCGYFFAYSTGLVSASLYIFIWR